MSNYRVAVPILVLSALLAPGLSTAAEDAAKVVAALDTEYQSAVERNDWQAMDRILHPDFTLVLGNGTVVSRAELIDDARKQSTSYEKQVEVAGTQKVRMYGKDTATVTALLWLKGKQAGAGAFDYQLWFTDTYVRTKDGWRYAFGQASMRLPPATRRSADRGQVPRDPNPPHVGPDLDLPPFTNRLFGDPIDERGRDELQPPA